MILIYFFTLFGNKIIIAQRSDSLEWDAPGGHLMQGEEANFAFYREILEDLSLKTKKIVTVEVENINQLKQILGLKFKRILFDNMNSSQLKNCLKLCKNKYETEYSGNATLKNIKQISKTGVNRISVGALTHSAKSFDTTLLFR